MYGLPMILFQNSDVCFNHVPVPEQRGDVESEVLDIGCFFLIPQEPKYLITDGHDGKEKYLTSDCGKPLFEIPDVDANLMELSIVSLLASIPCLNQRIDRDTIHVLHDNTKFHYKWTLKLPWFHLF